MNKLFAALLACLATLTASAQNISPPPTAAQVSSFQPPDGHYKAAETGMSGTIGVRLAQAWSSPL